MKKRKKDWKNYNKTKKFFLKTFPKTKQSYYENLNEKISTAMTKLWKTVTTILSNKSISNEKIVLIENEKKI